MKIIYGNQGTEDWFKLRAGKITASVVKKLFVKGQKGEAFGKGAHTEAKRLAWERIHGRVDVNQFFSHQTNRGNKYEHEARRRYEIEKFVSVTQVCFIDCGNYGCSPDGLIIDERGGLETKVYSRSDKHFDALVSKNDDHIHQIQFSLFCTKYDYWDYASYYPEDDKKIAIRRYYPDKVLHAQYEQKIAEFEILIEHYIQEHKNAA